MSLGKGYLAGGRGPAERFSTAGQSIPYDAERPVYAEEEEEEETVEDLEIDTVQVGRVQPGRGDGGVGGGEEGDGDDEAFLRYLEAILDGELGEGSAMGIPRWREMGGDPKKPLYPATGLRQEQPTVATGLRPELPTVARLGESIGLGVMYGTLPERHRSRRADLSSGAHVLEKGPTCHPTPGRQGREEGGGEGVTVVLAGMRQWSSPAGWSRFV